MFLPLQSYHSRIQLIEGAQLFRVRWYGGKRDDEESLPVPKGHQVFLERKTHHESWVGEESTKERFPFSLALMGAFCAGEITPEKAFEVMVLQGEMDAKDVAKHLPLARESQAKIVAQKLHPVRWSFEC